VAGQKQAQLTVEQGLPPGTTFTLAQLPAVIGRATRAEIVIDDRRISRLHARISRREDGFILEDMGSSNGVFVNGERITSAFQLRSGDQIGLGSHHRFRFELAPVQQTSEPPADATMILPSAAKTAPQEPPSPRLIVSLADGTTTTHILTAAEIRVGRAADNDIVISSPVISRQHLRLIRQEDDYLIQMLPTASNPCLLAGQPIGKEQVLRHNEELAVGPAVPEHTVTMRYEAAAPITAPVHRATDLVGTPALGDSDQPDAGAVTVLGQAAPLPPRSTPMLVVAVTGSEPTIHPLEGDEITVGRAPENDIVIAHRVVSNYQARLKWLYDGYELIPQSETTNPLYLNGQLVVHPTRLQHGAKLRLGSDQAGELVSLVYVYPAEAGGAAGPQTILFKDEMQLTIGRDKSNDIVLNAPSVSRFHAQIERAGQRYRLRDLRSSNGTFVNGQAVSGDVWLKPTDSIRIGPYQFVLGVDRLTEYDESHGLRVEAVSLNKWVRKDLNILQDISLAFQPSEFIVVVGQSGGGKSTLVDAIAGYRPTTHGRVYVNDVDVHANFDAIRSIIGFVPQKDIIHMELTVYQALDYAAQLRMPPDTTKEERHRRVMEVLADLDLTHRKDVQISGLSGGQQKRVSIGVELLIKPGLFFLDEPTSGLDPGTETSLMQLMRRLADQGRTIILITHATKNVMLADKVVFLARGGYLAWFGPPEEALAYFDQFRSERERRGKDIEFDDIYNLLDDPRQGTAAEWAERYQQHAAYQENVREPLKERLGSDQQQSPAVPAAAPARIQRPRQVSALRQFLILSARNIKILTRDRTSLILMLLIAPLLSSIDFVLAIGMGRNPFAFLDGDMNRVIVSLIVLTNSAIMVGGLSQMRELVKEREIYRRERLVNLRLIPYLMSKIWVAGLLALYMAAIFLLMRYLAFEMPGGVQEIMFLYITLASLVMAGMMLGLFASALAPNANAAPLFVILFIIPQIVLSGAMVPLPQTVTMPASSRWSFQAIMAITGGGTDVARDVCWALPEEQQKLLTSDLKRQYCNCMGVNALREESCSFPGVGEYYDESVDRSDPQEPPTIRDEPEPLALPPEPERPSNPNDPVAMQQYLNELLAYNDTVTQLRQAYEAEIAAYRIERELYQARLIGYQTELAELELSRAAATGSAEARIRFFHNDFSWTFVDKQDDAGYLRTLMTTWLAQSTIILLLFSGTVIMQRRRDVA
jgi:ABC transport system ATP-binding/permease protein